MKKYLLQIITGTGFSLTLLLSSCAGKNSAPEPMFGGPVAVATEEVKLSGVSYYDQYPGTVVALNQVELRPQVNGYITGIYFKDGDHVTKGQKLYSIDAQLYSANYDQAVANLQVQETNLDKAQKDADRYHALEKEDAIAKQQVDYADAALAAAKKQVAAAKANVQSVQTGVNYTTIVAPFTGTIGISQVKAQTAVTAGVTLLNTVSTDDPMAVDFVIDQKDIYHFTQLQRKASTAFDSTFTLVFGADDVYPFSGKINFLDRAVDPQTGTLKVRLEFPNKSNLLRVGMSCNVKVHNENRAPQVLIPYKAVTEQLGDYFVYVVKGDKVSQQKIAAGNHIGPNLIVKDGLKEHDMIVIEGVQKLHEGSVIQVGDGYN
jgi:membrane fusion protein (multidrug efflux system)